MVFAFRRLATTDLVLLHEWLNEPGVVEWWEGDDVSWDAVRRDYDPASPDSTEHVFGLHPTWSQACAGPFAANTASWRALERAGFRRVGVIDDPEGPCNLMVIDRADVELGDTNRVGG